MTTVSASKVTEPGEADAVVGSRDVAFLKTAFHTREVSRNFPEKYDNKIMKLFKHI